MVQDVRGRGAEQRAQQCPVSALTHHDEVGVLLGQLLPCVAEHQPLLHGRVGERGRHGSDLGVEQVGSGALAALVPDEHLEPQAGPAADSRQRLPDVQRDHPAAAAVARRAQAQAGPWRAAGKSSIPTEVVVHSRHLQVPPTVRRRARVRGAERAGAVPACRWARHTVG